MNKRLRKVLMITVLLLGVVSVGAKIAFDYAADKMVKKMADEVSSDPQVQKLLKDKDVQNKIAELHVDPALQKKIDDMAKEVPSKDIPLKESASNTGKTVDAQGNNKAGKAQDTSPATKKAGNNSSKASGSVHFDNTSEAARFAMKRFSVSEINRYRQMVGDGITPAEKKELKQVALSRFSPEEIRALIEVARK